MTTATPSNASRSSAQFVSATAGGLGKQGGIVKQLHVIGIDPGLVHTGIVSFSILPTTKVFSVASRVVSGVGVDPIVDEVRFMSVGVGRSTSIFIEGYRPRSNFGTDEKMVQAVSEIHKALPGSKVLNNTGVKKVVTEDLMKYLGCWNFSTPTHHQDLRSAARIALLGMFKDDELNAAISSIIEAHLDGRQPWQIAT